MFFSQTARSSLRAISNMVEDSAARPHGVAPTSQVPIRCSAVISSVRSTRP